jgi:type IV pilus assembly protein PilM
MASTIGLDIGTSAVRAVQVSAGGRGPVTLERLGQVLLPAGAVRDGELVEPAAVSEAIRTLWSRYGFKAKKVALGVANQQVVVRQVDLPYLPDHELRQSLEFQAAEYIPIPIEQAILDFHVLEHYQTDGGQRLSRVLLVAAQRTMVETVVNAVRAAKLEPVMVDLDAFAVMRALSPQGAVAGSAGEMLIDIGASVTNIVVHEAGTPRFVRILLMGGATTTESLVGALGITHDQADRLKATGGGDPSSDAARLISERANRFVDEIRGSLDFYVAQASSSPVRRVLLTGGGSLLPGLRQRLEQALQLPVEAGHPFQDLKIGKVGLGQDQLVEAQPYLAVAVGLAMGAAE